MSNITTIKIMGKEIPVRYEDIEQQKLLFYPENPRIFSALKKISKENPTQEEIQEIMSQMDHVNVLIQSIKANGGLTDPVIVRDGDFVVFEGNSRLAAYRKLASKDPIAWGKIRCQILPNDIDEKDVFTLLGQYHIISRKDWAPYEQAGYLYRRLNLYNSSVEKMSKEMGQSTRFIQHLIDTYTFMVNNNCNDLQKWSYFEEYLKSNYIKKTRLEFDELDKAIVEQVKNGKISSAVDIRDKLVPISKLNGSLKDKIIKKFVKGEIDLDTAFEKADDLGANSTLIQKFKKFKDTIADSEIVGRIENLTVEQQEKCTYELKKIRTNIDSILKNIEQRKKNVK